ncbi:MAG TPA: Na+/H+ antiporter NhaA [Actinomycetota bacterium]|nr:Na+/H+ antiporter NhaA [Actinomycetota bacterium]
MSEPVAPDAPSPSRHDALAEVRPPWSRSDRLVPRRVVQPLQEFLQTSTASASLLFLAVIVALVWANSPWKAGYEALFSTELAIRIGSLVDLDEDLHFWVNDGLMALFFLVVGLEIKREVVSGELRQLRVAALPIMAAIGGMVAPALIYLAVAGGGETGRGWGIPMATDIAFALGVLALAASYASPRLKPLLLTLAIVDDIGAIIVIAIFYTGGVDATALIAAFGTVGLIAIANAVHIRFILLYVLLGAALWYATYQAGIHPTIAGVVLGLLTPAAPFQRPAAVSEQARRTADETSDDPTAVDDDAQWWMRLAWLSREAVSPLVRTEHALLPWTSFVILPIFALANAGVELSLTRLGASLTAPVSVGIFLGLVLGKPVGVLLGSFITVRTGLGRLGGDVGWGDLTGMGMTAGIGFTVALFIAELAFPPGPRLDEAKTAILAASLVAGVAGYLILRVAPSPGVDPGDTVQSDALQRDAAQ